MPSKITSGDNIVLQVAYADLFPERSEGLRFVDLIGLL